MKQRFLIADPHFGHHNIVKFTDKNGNLIRPWTNLDEMQEDMVQRWNETVDPGDTVYLLGDVCMTRKSLPILGRLNGRKVLIKGNHDIWGLKDYTPYFADIRGVVKMGDYYLTHIPLHEASLPMEKWCKGNIHGHLHARRVLMNDGSIHPWYLCVSAEHTDYRPMAFEAAVAAFENQQSLVPKVMRNLMDKRLREQGDTID